MSILTSISKSKQSGIFLSRRRLSNLLLRQSIFAGCVQWEANYLFQQVRSADSFSAFLHCIHVTVLFLGLAACDTRHGIVEVPRTLNLTSKVQPNHLAEDVLQIRNRGNFPLTIKYLKVSCGCLSAKIANKTIAPHSTADLSVMMDLSTKLDVVSVEEQIIICTSDAKTPIVKVVVRASPNRSAYLGPENINLGRIDKSKLPYKREILFKLTDPGVITLINQSSKIKCVLTQKSGSQYSLQIELIETINSGALRELLLLKWENHTTNILVSGEVTDAQIAITPTIVNSMGADSKNTSKDITFQLKYCDAFESIREAHYVDPAGVVSKCEVENEQGFGKVALKGLNAGNGAKTKLTLQIAFNLKNGSSIVKAVDIPID